MADAALDAVDLHAVRVALGNVSAKTVQRLIAKRRFPKPFTVTAQGKMWFRRDVEWYLWGRSLRWRMVKKRRTTVDKPGTTVDKPKSGLAK